MIEKVYESSINFISNMPKDKRKKYGQFITDDLTAQFMASLFSFDGKEEISVLDPGAGSGILTCAFIEEALKNGVKKIDITCFENDENIIPLLRNNLEYCAREAGCNIIYKIIDKNYITSQREQYLSKKSIYSFDYVISNPPYLKISSSSEEALSMSDVCFGAPNLYFMFFQMAIFNSNINGELVFIIPRSWTSGAYFSKFRERLLASTQINQIHLFVSRTDVFHNGDEVLQETIIIKVTKKVNDGSDIKITSTFSAKSFEEVNEIMIPQELSIGRDGFVFLIKNENEKSCFTKICKFRNTLISDGFRMKTGIVVDFREREILRETNEAGTYPLFYSTNIKQPYVVFPSGEQYSYVKPVKNGSVQNNENYLFVKRFSSKEEKRRLQPSMFKKSQYFQFDKISTQNKINFITSIDGVMSDEELHGLYCIFNSKSYDLFYRILNGSTQVNSTEVNLIPMPSREVIRDLGRKLLLNNDFSSEMCERIMEEIYEQN